MWVTTAEAVAQGRGSAEKKPKSADEWRAEAERLRKIGDSREIAAVAMSKLSVDPELSLLLAVEAGQIAPTKEAEAALRQSFVQDHVRMVLRGHGEGITALAVNSNATLLATGSGDNTARVWDIKTGKSLVELGGHDKWLTSIDLVLTDSWWSLPVSITLPAFGMH